MQRLRPSRERRRPLGRLARAALALPFVVLPAALPGCGEDDAIVDPPPPPGPHHEATFGPEGGELALDQVGIVVPAGAFDEEVTIAVEPVDDEPASAGAVTGAVRIAGLPATWDQPILLRLPYAGDLSGLTVIYASQDRDDPFSGAPITRCTGHDATAAGGWLEAALLPALAPERGGAGGVAAGSKDDPVWMQIFGLTGMQRRLLPAPDADPVTFVVEHHASYAPVVDGLESALEDAYRFWQDEGFVYTHAGNQLLTLDRIRVRIGGGYRSDPTRLGYATVVPWDDDDVPYGGYHTGRPTIAYHEDDFTPTNLPDLRRQTGAMMLTLAHCYSAPWSDDDAWWWRRATANWAEGLFPPAEGYIPAPVVGTERAVLAGLAARGPWQTSRRYADSFTAVVKHLTQEYGRGLLATVAGRLRSHEPSVDAVLAAVPESPSVWWPEFVAAHLGGQVYPVDADTLLADLDGVFTVATAGDTVASFTEEYADLAARRFRVDLARPAFDPDEGLRFRVSGGVDDEADLEVLVFAVDGGGDLVLLDRANDLTITGLDLYAGQGQDLLAVVTCAEIAGDSYGTRPVTLEIRNEVPPDEVVAADYTRASIAIRFHAWEVDGEEHPDEQIMNPVIDGAFEEGFFSAVWDSLNYSYHHFGHLQLNVAESPLRVTAFDLRRETGYVPHPEYGHKVEEGRGTGGIAFAGEGEDQHGRYHQFRIDGPAACDAIDHLDVVRYNWAGNILIFELASWGCNSSSSVDVKLYFADRSAPPGVASARRRP